MTAGADTAPRVSVLMPVHNGAEYLPAAIDSILTQTMADFELLVLDDGSTDSSHVLAQRAASRDPRVRVLALPRVGLPRALNHGLEAARAPLIARMDADDIALPRRLEIQLAFMDDHPDVGVVGGQFDPLSACGVAGRNATRRLPCNPEDLAELSILTNMICHPTAVMRTELVRRLGGYRASVRYAEDYDLWLRVLDHAKLANVPQVVLRYRRHPDAIGRRFKSQQMLDALAARASALGRRMSNIDPIAALESIDEAALTALPLRDDVRALWAAIGFLQVVYHRGAERPLCDWFEREARRCLPAARGPLASIVLARGYLARARWAHDNRRYPRALRDIRRSLEVHRRAALEHMFGYLGRRIRSWASGAPENPHLALPRGTTGPLSRMIGR